MVDYPDKRAHLYVDGAAVTSANPAPVQIQTGTATMGTADITIGGVAPQLDDTDKLAVSMYGNGGAAGDTSIPVSLAGADAVANTVDGVRTVPMPMLFNGTTWDRQRNNEEITLLASAARTATTSSAEQVNYNARGIVLIVDCTAITATPSVQLQVLSGLVGSTAKFLFGIATHITAVGMTAYLLYPGVLAGAAGGYSEAVNLTIPRRWKITMVHADADSITYGVWGFYIL